MPCALSLSAKFLDYLHMASFLQCSKEQQKVLQHYHLGLTNFLFGNQRESIMMSGMNNKKEGECVSGALRYTNLHSAKHNPIALLLVTIFQLRTLVGENKKT